MRPSLTLLLLLVVLAASPAAAATRPSGQDSPPDILALSPEIESFIEARVDRGQPRSVVVRSLMDALFGKDGLGIAYGNTATKTALETFESRSGNCLSFTVLFVALARHVGLEAHFLEVSEILSWGRRGDVAVSNRHMFAEVETGEGLMRVDFLPGVEKRYRSVRRIGERRVLAHYYSNLGAEALTANQLDLAEELFARALEADATLAAAWVNLGVTQRRRGRPGEAERSYLKALELDSNEVSAASNLVVLYRATDRERLAAPYRRLVRRHERRNPFYHFRRGLEWAREGDLRRAVRSLKRATRLLPEDAMFRAELGKLYVRAGRERRAERSFERALELSADEAQRRRLEQLLANVRGDSA